MRCMFKASVTTGCSPSLAHEGGPLSRGALSSMNALSRGVEADAVQQ